MTVRFKFFFQTVCILLLFLFPSLIFAQTASDRAFAAEDFRRGVQSYYRGAFNDAVLQFEKALSYLPAENLILDWLGKAYYRSGIEGAAVQQWETAAESGYGGILLQNRIETVRQRRLTHSFYAENTRYAETGLFTGVSGETLYFSQPISALPRSDGTCWVLAYGSNELLRLDANGLILERLRGPVNGFDRPMDIIRQINGTLLISEFAGDRVSVLRENGQYVKSFGQTGTGEGGLLGPQYLAVDGSGNVYVTDFGNARVSVFDSEGQPLFSFGQRNAVFKGFSAPSGIAIVDGDVFVADAVFGGVYRFDTAGNYLGQLVPDKTFKRPEALKPWGDYLLLADGNHVYSVNSQTGAVFETAGTGNAPSRITCAVQDINGNLILTDFKANQILTMTEMSQLVGGMFVQIDRVISDKFPEVTVQVRVENRNRLPVSGLSDVNFFITENRRPVSNQRLTGVSSKNEICDITILIDRGTATAAYATAVETAVRDIASSMNGRGTLRIVSAGMIPVIEYSGSPGNALSFGVSQLKAPVVQVPAFDLGVRLAANDLINGEMKRSIVYITAGDFSAGMLKNYGLTDLTSYLGNNSIQFSVINVTNAALAPEIQHLIDRVPGESYYVYRPEGLQEVVSAILREPVALYQLTYTSLLNTDFGRAWLPIEVEAYVHNRSGRDESGYFAPLE